MKRLSLTFFYLLQAIPAILPAGLSAANPLTVVFRLDDFSERSASGLEEKIVDTFEKNGFVLTLGVTPFVCAGDGHDPGAQQLLPLTRARAAFFKPAVERGNLEIALHGYSHQTVRRKVHPLWSEFAGYDYSEFYGVPLGTQAALIEKGRKHLEDIFATSVTTFIPPWNSYDRNTLRALESAGFRCLSAAPRGYTLESSDLKYAPATCSLAQLAEALDTADRIRDSHGQLIVVMMHPTEFTLEERDGNRMSLGELGELLARLGSRKELSVRTIARIGESDLDLGARRFSYFNLYRKAVFFAPFFINQSQKNVYLTREESAKLALAGWALDFFYYLILLAGGFFLGKLVTRKTFSARPSIKNNIRRSLLFALFVLLLIGLALFLSGANQKMTAAAILTGLIPGFLGLGKSNR